MAAALRLLRRRADAPLSSLLRRYSCSTKGEHSNGATAAMKVLKNFEDAETNIDEEIAKIQVARLRIKASARYEKINMRCIMASGVVGVVLGTLHVAYAILFIPTGRWP